MVLRWRSLSCRWPPLIGPVYSNEPLPSPRTLLHQWRQSFPPGHGGDLPPCWTRSSSYAPCSGRYVGTEDSWNSGKEKNERSNIIILLCSTNILSAQDFSSTRYWLDWQRCSMTSWNVPDAGAPLVCRLLKMCHWLSKYFFYQKPFVNQSNLFCIAHIDKSQFVL